MTRCPQCRDVIAHDAAWGFGCNERECYYAARPSRYPDPVRRFSRWRIVWAALLLALVIFPALATAVRLLTRG